MKHNALIADNEMADRISNEDRLKRTIDNLSIDSLAALKARCESSEQMRVSQLLSLARYFWLQDDRKARPVRPDETEFIKLSQDGPVAKDIQRISARRLERLASIDADGTVSFEVEHRKVGNRVTKSVVKVKPSDRHYKRWMDRHKRHLNQSL